MLFCGPPVFGNTRHRASANRRLSCKMDTFLAARTMAAGRSARRTFNRFVVARERASGKRRAEGGNSDVSSFSSIVLFSRCRARIPMYVHTRKCGRCRHILRVKYASKKHSPTTARFIVVDANISQLLNYATVAFSWERSKFHSERNQIQIFYSS